MQIRAYQVNTKLLAEDILSGLSLRAPKSFEDQKLLMHSLVVCIITRAPVHIFANDRSSKLPNDYIDTLRNYFRFLADNIKIMDTDLTIGYFRILIEKDFRFPVAQVPEMVEWLQYHNYRTAVHIDIAA